MTVLTAPRRDTKLDRLARHPLLARCSPADLARVAAVFDEVTIPAGDAVVAAGPLARWFFLIDDGIADAGGRQLGPGDFCGEDALVLHSTQPVTVRARTDLRVFAASGREVMGLVSRVPNLARGPLAPPARPLRPLAPLPPRPRPARTRPLPRPVHHTSVRISDAQSGANPDRSKRRWIVGVLVTAAVLLGGAAMYHPPVLLVAPGPAVDITDDVSIPGVEVDVPRGRYLLTSVRLSRPSLLSLGLSQFGARRHVVHLAPAGDREAIRQRERSLFEGSRRDAVTAAAKAVGVAVPAGVQFRQRDIVGPSAGLAYALLIADLLTPGDLSGGRIVAATGTIDRDGLVGLVAGIADKAIGARHAGSALLLLPIDQLAGTGDLGLTVVGVSSLDEALAALRS